MINLNQLRTFYFVARHSSYTTAAEKLFISQPAVTAQIKLFENYHDLKLFKKSGRKIILTHTGKILFEKAAHIFEMEDEIENILSQIKQLNQGVLEIGCTKAYARHIMPSIISVFHRAYPDIKIVLQEGSSMAMINSLLNFQNEVIVVARMQPDDPRLKFIPFSQEEIVIILPKKHPLAGKQEFEFHEIAMEPVILKGQGSGTRKKILDLYNQHNCRPNIFMESNNTGFIIDLVERGEGISFLVKPAVDREIKEKKLAMGKLKDFKLFLDVSFGYLKNTPFSPAAKAFYGLLTHSFIEKTRQGNIGSIMAKILAGQLRNG